jgi:hypothetical protein
MFSSVGNNCHWIIFVSYVSCINNCSSLFSLRRFPVACYFCTRVCNSVLCTWSLRTPTLPGASLPYFSYLLLLTSLSCHLFTFLPFFPFLRPSFYWFSNETREKWTANKFEGWLILCGCYHVMPEVANSSHLGRFKVNLFRTRWSVNFLKFIIFLCTGISLYYVAIIFNTDSIQFSDVCMLRIDVCPYRGLCAWLQALPSIQ